MISIVLNIRLKHLVVIQSWKISYFD